MKAQGVIFDILVHGVQDKPLSLGDIGMQIASVTGQEVHPFTLHEALKLLVATGEVKASGPSHDMYSALYVKTGGR